MAESSEDDSGWCVASLTNTPSRGTGTFERVELPVELHADGGDPGLEREGREAWQLVHGFVETLDDTRRAVFVATLLEGWSAAETAQATGLALVTVHNRIRALRRSFNLWLERHRREP